MSRGRGRPPHRMLDEAEELAAKRGGVIMVPGTRSDAFDLIICEEFRTVFVRCRSTTRVFFQAFDVIRTYARDIARISRLPLTKVIAWEFWLRLPRGKWQFFLVGRDSIVEIRKNGTIQYRDVLPVPVEEGMGEEDTGAAPEECIDGDDGHKGD